MPVLDEPAILHDSTANWDTNMDSLERLWNIGTFAVSTFPSADHCFAMQEGVFIVRMKAGEKHTVDEDETSIIPAGQGFALAFGGKFIRVWKVKSGDVVEAIIHRACAPF
jgi:hypothetical protein